MKPLIGITAYNRQLTPESKPYQVCYAKNAHAIAHAGGLPVLIPQGISEEALLGIYERLDGILLPGGGDVAPSFYQADPHTTVDGVDSQRDILEMMLVRRAYADDLPVLGICRGLQVMNVALGGSLIQDIPDVVGGTITHNITKAQLRSELLHQVTIDKTSYLAEILGDTRVPVNSIHHQSLERIAEPLAVTGRADDTVVEAAEIPARRFMVGVQWHPEDLYIEHTCMQNLFSHFVKVASVI